jgi:hypothetical protein
MRFRRRRRRPAVRPIGELQAYARLDGERGGDVTFVKIQPRRLKGATLRFHAEPGF